MKSIRTTQPIYKVGDICWVRQSVYDKGPKAGGKEQYQLFITVKIIGIHIRPAPRDDTKIKFLWYMCEEIEGNMFDGYRREIFHYSENRLFRSLDEVQHTSDTFASKIHDYELLVDEE